MPLYEYTCRDCERFFETLVFDGEEVVCPYCQGRRLQDGLLQLNSSSIKRSWRTSCARKTWMAQHDPACTYVVKAK